MDKVGNANETAKRPCGDTPRAGQSGEGSRSALEQLIQQEKQRQAQRASDASRSTPTEPLP
jgi:hypothetical protein